MKKRRMITLLLSLLMVAAFVPSTASADEEAQQQTIEASFDKSVIYVDGGEDAIAQLTVAPEDTVRGVNVGNISAADTSGCVAVKDEGVSKYGHEYQITAVRAGTGAVCVTAAGNDQYAPASMTCSIKVVKTSTIKSGNVKLSYYSATYNGKARKPAVTVKVGGKTLKKGTNYTVTYADNKDPGTAVVTVKGKTPQYTGTVKKTFTINKASQKISVYLYSAGGYKKSSLPGNKTRVMTIKQNPQEGSVNAGTFTYRSSNTSVLTCSRTANHNCDLNSRDPGSVRVTITADETTYYKKATKTMYFTVVDPSPSGHTYPGTFPTLPSRGYFKQGDTGTQVVYLQKFLKWAGYPITTHGTYGDLTVSTVKQFQRDHGLNVDGLFGRSCLYAAKHLRR